MLWFIYGAGTPGGRVRSRSDEDCVVCHFSATHFESRPALYARMPRFLEGKKAGLQLLAHRDEDGSRVPHGIQSAPFTSLLRFGRDRTQPSPWIPPLFKLLMLDS